MAQEPTKTPTEDKTVPHGILQNLLGGLPSELLDKILFEINAIRYLGRFIATARFVYQRFNVHRRAVLFRVLQNELGPVLADARFLFVFPYSDFTEHPSYIEWLHLMAGVYHDLLRESDSKDDTAIQHDTLPYLEELKSICRTLHQVNFIADMYARARLASFDAGGGSGTPVTEPLSPVERRRLVRAIYRRQIISNAWAATRRRQHWTLEDEAAISNSSTHDEDELGLLGTFEPWEMQQIDHADSFITRLCLSLVHHSPRRVDGAAGIAPRQFDELFAHLHRLVPFLRTHDRVAELAARDMARPWELTHYSRLRDGYVNPYQMIIMRNPWQASLETAFPDPVREQLERDGLVVPYVGDGLDLAPYGWLDALRVRYVKWYGEGLDNTIPLLPGRQTRRHTLHLWEHAVFCLWDRERVETLKGLSVFGGGLYTGWLMNCSVDSVEVDD
ncbi:hypothetical protein N658DRAFT_488355 [Parathielavia hyrcaniae]|uniref:Uncharacterized protein n=1 Tax=Parathielavia hyrcaniae TaxID=113614 RepID=A0AAN6SZE7_9PEZI|nr:hypothetical protein N658DRAFT_488355 [Parathielavia hyrcaniae]